RAGAAAFIDDPIEPGGLDTALARLERLAQGPDRGIALIADDGGLDEATASLLSGDENIALERIAPADALKVLRTGEFDLAVVAIGRPRSEAFALVREAATDLSLR